MKVNFFIDRPIFSAVISIVIVIVGIIGLTMLPIDQYPQITPPVVKISASYPGASATTVSQAVATPIEQELNGTPGMLYMESTSSNSGGFSATVTFDISADPDLSAVEIQNRLKLAESRLPAEVIQNGISVEKQAASQLMTICLTSTDPKFDEIYLSNFATINVLDLLRRIPGVGRVSNIGSRYYAMQIWVQPDKMANFGLTVQDLQNALKDQNRESAAGVLGQQPVTGVDVTIPITTQGRLSTVSQFEDIVVRANPDGSIIRLRDVARVSLEASSYNTESGINGGNAAVLGVYMLPGANAMEVAENVKKAMEDISRNFPEGLTYEIPFDMTTYISESIHEVYKTLFEALDRALAPSAAKTPARVLVHMRNAVVQSIECDDIIYIESIGYTRVVHTWGGVYEEMRKTLSSLLEELDGLCPGRFFSPYRGYIVNLDHIATITPAHIEMRDGSRILIKRGDFRRIRDIFFAWTFSSKA